jgi:hypothetical protein
MVLRLATRNLADPEQIARATLEPMGIAVHDYRETRVTVEDAFVSMVRDDDDARRGERAA